ncbi:B3 domain-containing protein Os11g0197600-like isoform X2 [Phragmites australis]|uniref:B3 domain-containing protein Os11g0197600-like isoform X2 n=1 Tax=Phragmites australis TaxID=29695 RepID=UPI002D79D1E6|nr:B3 domain-containing protein Os11g0197600-like isoform X2 [Phragmites australis]
MRHKKEQESSGVAVAVKENGAGKGKEKEKKKEKGKEREEGEAKNVDQGKESKNVGHRFFKVFFPEQSGERLKIPPPFHQYLEEEPTGLVSLKSSSGNTWQVLLTSDSEGLCFAQGWKEFVRDHSLKNGHFLVFTYSGHSQFSVVVFCSSGVEDPSALVAQPCKAIVVKVEEDEGGRDIVAAGTSEVLTLPLEEVDGITGKRTRGMNDLMADGPAPKKHSSFLTKAEKKRPEAIVGTSKAAGTVPNDFSISLLDEYTCCNKTRIRDKDVPRSGKFILKKARQPVVISQRRPVTEEEKNFALKRAKEFKSKHPFSVQIMMESYVYVGFFMNIPCDFVRESLPKTSKKMTLWDPQGQPWEVNYVYYSERCIASFSGGWGKFALGNNLEKFDVCVFELFKEDNIKVHIYRVIPEITPLLRSRNR